MPIPELSPKTLFGLRTDVKQNAHYISDFQVLYPAGSVLVIHNYYEKRQKYIKLYEKSSAVELIVVSPSRKLVAVVENAERGQIVIYDLQTLKRRRTLNLPNDSTTNRFETVTFSHDDKYIMAITGDPDWQMVSYNWEKGKVENMTKANYPNSPAIPTQICCSPSDNGEICLIGPGLFRLLSLTETVWRQYGFQKADQIHISCATWLNGERIICGTNDGKLLLIDGGDLRAAFNAFTVMVINMKEKDEVGASSSSLTIIKTSSDFSGEDDRQVRALIAFSKGFAYSCRIGYVHMFEKESHNRYRKRNVFRIMEQLNKDFDPVDLYTVKHLSLNVSQDKLLATTNRAQIYNVRLWGPDLHVAPEIPFRLLGEPLHNGLISGLSMCIWKPIMVSCGQYDKSVRIWNYETQTVDMIKIFDEEIYSVALHPTGYFVSIGFTERLTFMIVLLDDIQPLRDFLIRECRLSLFSYHGHFLAAIRNTTIEVYNYVSFQLVQTLKGHTGTVNAMAWSLDDRKLASVSVDGAIVLWDLIDGKKIGEVITPGVSYHGCAMTSDGKFIYAVGNDGLMKEVSESNITRIIDLGHKYLKHIVISRSDQMMFACGDNNSVVSIKIPLIAPYQSNSFYYHNSKIQCMKLSYDDQNLVTVSDAGALIMWKLSRTEGKIVSMDKDFAYSKDILISRSQLEEKINLLKDLGVKLFDLEMDHASQMRSCESTYAVKIKEIEDTYNQAIEELKEKIDSLETDQENQLMRINEDVNELKLKQEKEEQELHTNYRAKLELEYFKIQKLSTEKEEITNVYESQVAELMESRETETEEIIKMYEAKLVDINQQLQESSEKNAQNIVEHSKVKQQFEDDADREIIETKAEYEKILKEERENNEKQKAEAVNMRKKFVAAQKSIDEYRRQTDVLNAEHQKFQSIIQALEKDIQDLKKEIEERDLTIEDKDKRILDLKKKIHELEKFKFVLDYKIKELKNQIDPKDREIREKKEQIEDMEKELENLQKINTSLELQLKELKEKTVATEKEVSIYESQHESGYSVLRKIKIDLYNLYQHLDEAKMLKDGIKNLYLKYNQDEVFIRGQEVDTDLQKEFMQQREFLEKTILALQSTLRKNLESKKEDNLKVLEDNVVLVEELNQMRKQFKETSRKVQNLEGLLGMKPGRSVTPREAYSKLQQTLKRQDLIKEEYEQEAEAAWKDTQELNERVEKLYEKLHDISEHDKMAGSDDPEGDRSYRKRQNFKD